ncbi:MAG: hypothetical protein HC836_50570 [Richelia sp. RM2_1_2]|nr:hypothetical protein [Richelia sp. RM2_1_2]
MENRLILKVVKIGADSLQFDNGMILLSNHDQQCCESHYLCLSDLTLDDFKGLEFDLSNGDFFERIKDYGIALKPKNGFPVRIPGYGNNNGCYSPDLTLIITNSDGKGIFKQYDIEECQAIVWE